MADEKWQAPGLLDQLVKQIAEVREERAAAAEAREQERHEAFMRDNAERREDRMQLRGYRERVLENDAAHLAVQTRIAAALERLADHLTGER